jgi:hypothetical protein
MVVISLAAAPSFPAEQQADTIGSAFSIRWENDAFDATDANYTSGASLAYTHKGPGLIGGVWNLFGEPEGKRFASYDVAQLQFTPVNLELHNPDPRDRPYAGFLYLGLATFLQRGENLHGLKLFAGAVGPASLAEQAQKLVHRTFGYHMPQGWEFQIKNEPIINLLYEYRHRFSLTPHDGAFGVQLIPVGGAYLGNFLIQAQGAAQIRVGYHLPDDFGTTILPGIGYLPFPQDDASSRAWGCYAYAGSGANFVAWNITLDGNTFAHSRNVDKRPVVPFLEYGASLWTRWFQATFSYVMLGKEFYGQKVREDFGSIVFSTYFN